MPVANIYRNTEDNCQCTLQRATDVQREKFSAAGLCLGWDRNHPYGLRLIGKFHHLKKVLEDNGIDLMDLASDIEVVPTTNKAGYGRTL